MSDGSWPITTNEYGDHVDPLGFTQHRCPHCNACMVRATAGNLLCLNACMLPTWQYRIMQAGLRESARAVDAELAKERADGR